jgi:hypothetical protein
LRDINNCGVWMLLAILNMMGQPIKSISEKVLLDGCIKYLKT